MSALILLLGVSFIVSVGFLIVCISAIKNGQYEDDYTPSVRILFEDKPMPKQPLQQQSDNSTNEHK
ncbi:cbb3-type cytochrome oxidase assembly protein [Solitalea koreensis]|uniref:Cytochrome oxidase maturation protein, cbb3-type n=1 Tax=Solitalea koreensis TaxID=543615 RepID=A0A521BEI0_9SPHI|nr:cbb3-type cytochrome oxidase assembly protein [Solitalea koreensis]SMO45496.1 cytochrome oxidase maturation protein, cbb3-type [Solitalea koreensis]